MGPEIIATVGLISSVASTAFGAFSAIQSGNYQAGIARNNAIIAQQRADAARLQGVLEAQNQDYKTRAALGAITAQQGASGIDISGRSAEDVRAGTAMLGRYDALMRRSNAENEAYGFEIKKADYLADAEAKRSAGMMNAIGSIIGGAGSVASKWDSFRTKSLLT